MNDYIYIILFCFFFSLVFYFFFNRTYHLKKNKIHILLIVLSFIIGSSLFLYLPLGVSLGVLEDKKILKLIDDINYLENKEEVFNIYNLIESEILKSRKIEEIESEKIVLLSELYNKTNNIEGVTKSYNILIERYPNDANYYALLAQVKFLNLNQFTNIELIINEIIDLLDKSLTINPEQPLALSIFGMIAYQNGQFQEAINFWNKAIIIYGKESPESISLIKGIISSQEKLNSSKNKLNK